MFQEGGQLHDHFINSLATLISCGTLPVRLVDNKGFQFFIQNMLPRYKLPSRRTMTRLIEPKFDRVRKKIEDRLSGTNCLAITCDSSTDTLNNRSYLGVTCHFMEGSDLPAQTIAVKEHVDSHTGVNISDMLQEVMDDWCIDRTKIICAVTDNGANMKSAVNLFLGPKNHVSCFAHTLNLCVQDTIKNVPEFNSLVEKVKSIVTFFKHSTKASSLLRAEQEKGNNSKALSLKQSRWNSVYIMMERFEKLFIPLTIVCLSLPTAPNMISAPDLRVIQDGLGVLKPFLLATTELSAESKTTLSKVIPICSVLRTAINCSLAETDAGKKLQRTALKNFTTRFDKIEKSSFHNGHEIQKKDFSSIVDATQAVSLLNDELNNFSKEHPQLELIEAENSGLWSFRNLRPSEVVVNGSPLDEAFRMYLNSNVSPIDNCPIETWQSLMQFNLPLSQLASKYLTIHATSVPSQRLFSKAGTIISKLLSSLEPKKAEKLIILSSCDPKFVFRA